MVCVILNTEKITLLPKMTTPESQVLGDTELGGLVKWTFDVLKQLNYETVKDFVLHAPSYYSQWWRKLSQETPLHILIETGLICFIIWLMFIRRTVDPRKSSKNERLTDAEINELLDEWTPEPLIPELTAQQSAVSNSRIVSAYVL